MRTRVWVSFQVLNRYRAPLTVRAIAGTSCACPPLMTVAVHGAAPAAWLTVMEAPDGTEATCTDDVSGQISTVVEADTPWLSVAVSFSWRRDGYSWSGAVIEPELAPSIDLIRCA